MIKNKRKKKAWYWTTNIDGVRDSKPGALLRRVCVMGIGILRATA
jgi:hypothetical protein